MKYFLFFILLGFVSGCGLRPAPPMQKEIGEKGKALSESLQVSQQENYIVLSIKKELIAGETNSVQYRWVSSELKSLDDTVLSFKVEYWMPEMPEMGKFEAVPTFTNGVLSVDLDIVHGGLWEVILIVQEHEKPVDRVIFNYQVAE